MKKRIEKIEGMISEFLGKPKIGQDWGTYKSLATTLAKEMVFKDEVEEARQKTLSGMLKIIEKELTRIKESKMDDIPELRKFVRGQEEELGYLREKIGEMKPSLDKI